MVEDRLKAKVIGTKIEVDKEDLVMGGLLSKNCYGEENVNRLLQVEPRRDEYNLYAYGDSRGDKEMLVFSDEGVMVNGRVSSVCADGYQ